MAPRNINITRRAQRIAKLRQQLDFLLADTRPEPYLDMAKMGEILFRARESLGLSQAQLAGLVGRSRTLITNLEAGRHNPPLDLLLAVTDHLGLSLGEVINECVTVPDVPANPQAAKGEKDK